MDSSSNAAMDFGRFMTGFLVLTGIGELLLFSLRHFAYQPFHWNTWKQLWKILYHFPRRLFICFWLNDVIAVVLKPLLIPTSSPPRSSSPQRSDWDPSHDHVHLWWSVNLRNYHQLLYVLPGARRVLIANYGFMVWYSRSYLSFLEGQRETLFVHSISFHDDFLYAISLIFMYWQYTSNECWNWVQSQLAIPIARIALITILWMVFDTVYIYDYSFWFYFHRFSMYSRYIYSMHDFIELYKAGQSTWLRASRRVGGLAECHCLTAHFNNTTKMNARVFQPLKSRKWTSGQGLLP